MSWNARLWYLDYSSVTQLLLAFYLRDVYHPILKTSLEPAKNFLAHKLIQSQCSKYLATCWLFVTRLYKIAFEFVIIAQRQPPFLLPVVGAGKRMNAVTWMLKKCGPGINLALISAFLLPKGKMVQTRLILSFTLILAIRWHISDTTLMVAVIKVKWYLEISFPFFHCVKNHIRQNLQS